jgi:CMP-N,N'-diacetyllegionaminic acid synthase
MNNILYVVTARSGSKGLPGKNTKILNGLPLVQYTFNCLFESDIVNMEDVCVSTDDLQIIRIAKSQGLDVPFIRPLELSTDTSSSRDVLIHALDYYSTYNKKTYDTVVLLQPTSPFRESKHLDDAIRLYQQYTLRKQHIDMVVSVCGSKANPYFNLFEEKKGYLYLSKFSKITRRQDLPKVWEFNGAIYVINAKSLVKANSISLLKKIVPYEMSLIESLDIDTILDFELANIYMKKNK